MSFRRTRARTLRVAAAVFLALTLAMVTTSSVSAAGGGDGRMTVTPMTATYGATGQNFVFDFWNDEGSPFLGPVLGSHGSKVELTIPAGWTAPTGHITVAEGAFTYVWLLHPSNSCDPGSTSISGSGPWTITIPITCAHDDHLTITYSGVTVPAPATYPFTTRTEGTLLGFGDIGNAAEHTVTVSKANQTIAFDAAPTGVKVGAAGVTVHATATSGLAVSYSSTTPLICTVNAASGALTLLGAGTCNIAANQSGNGNWNPALQVTQDVAVGLNSQTIAFDSAPTGVKVGGSGVSVHATATPSGLAVSYNSTTLLICTVNAATGALTLLAAGTCHITADQAGNFAYAAAPQASQNVAVGLNSQTIAFDPAPTGVKVGASGVSVHATATSGLAVSYSSTTPLICSVNAASGALTLLAEGTCNIAADQAGNGTYAAASQVSQNVAVGLNSQTIAFFAAPAGVTVGAAGVSVHATATSSLPVAYSSTTPLICSVNAASGALTLLAEGTCNIAADQAGNGTYAAASQVSQNVAVGVAPVAQLSLVAAAVQPNFTKGGDIIDFTFTLANGGNVPLNGPFTVTSDKIASVVCPATPSGLAVGASIVCTGNYAVVLADMEAGKVVLTATGQGFSGQTPLATAASVVTVQKVPIESVGAATSVPSRAVTAPPTSTSGNSPSNSSTPLFALLICFAFAVLGLLAVQAQRQGLRR